MSIVRLPAILLILSLSVAGALGMAPHVQAEDKKPDAPPAGPPPTPVVVAAVRETNESPQGTYSAFMESIELARVSVLEAGAVHSIAKRAGDRAKRGEVLATLANPQMLLDLDVIEAQENESRAILAEAQLKLARLKSLFDKQLIPAEQFENEKAAVAVTEARQRTTRATGDRLRERLKLLTVRSPIDGQILAASLDLGQWVTQNTELYRIASANPIEMQVGVPGKFVNSVPENSPVSIEVPEIGEKLTGRIRAVVRHVDTASGNFTVRVVVDNPKGLPLSGLLARATVPTGSQAKVKVVPRDAIVRRGEATHVVTVRENKAQIVPVTITGGLGGDIIVVANDLKPREKVVVQGNERLFPGMPVNVKASP